MELNADMIITQNGNIGEIVQTPPPMGASTLRPYGSNGEGSIIPQFQSSPFHREGGNVWVEVFDPLAAVASVFKHVETLPSSRTTRHTARQYRICLYDFLRFCGAVVIEDQRDKTRMDGDSFDFRELRLHTDEQMRDYINYCIAEERSPKTIRKYLAPIHLYLDALRKQPFIGLRGEVRDLINDVKDILQLAADVDAPKDVYKSTESAGQRGIRLNLTQTKEYTHSIDRSSIVGKRDAAIFHVGLVSTLRVSEIQRIRLCDIKRGTKTAWEIVVLGKRNNIDPVGFDQEGYELIMDYVEAYNAGLDADDVRRITRTSALWQPLRHGNNYSHVGVNGYDPQKGLGSNAIRKMLKSRTPQVVCEQIGQDGIRPHDLRRTTALGLAEQNVPIPAIQRQLRHSNAQVTSDYIGVFTDLSRGLITNYWSGLWEDVNHKTVGIHADPTEDGGLSAQMVGL